MRTRRVWVRIFIVLAALAALAAVAVGIWIARIGFGAVGDLASGALALGAELQQARRAGVPLEPSDLRPSPPVPPDRNAAPFMRELGELYWALPETERHRTEDLLTAMGSPNRARDVVIGYPRQAF